MSGRGQGVECVKDAYYFSHDANARNDPKCSALISDWGAEGYGIYWIVIEILAEQKNYKLRKFKKLYEGLARQLWEKDTEKIRSIIEAMLHDYELLVEDDDYIWSESLLRRMEIKENKRLAKVEAGRLGGIKSGISRVKAKQNEAEMKQCFKQNEANEPKESKVKESKVNKISYADAVKMTEEEHQNLIDKFGEVKTNDLIDRLNSYKLSSGKKYKSDYHTILTWDRKDKEKQPPPKPKFKDPNDPRTWEMQ